MIGQIGGLISGVAGAAGGKGKKDKGGDKAEAGGGAGEIIGKVIEMVKGFMG
jgi:hypothetical protein